MGNVVSLAAANTDVQIKGARASALYGAGATYWYPGNKAVLTPDRIAEMFATTFMNADNYRKNFIPEILEAYTQYNGETSQPGREPWQSDIHVPLPAQAIDIATGRMFSAIFDDEDFFEVAPNRKADTLLTEFAQRGVKWQIAKGKGKVDIKTALKDALICGVGYVKIHFESVIENYTETEWQPGPPLPGEVVSSMGDWQFKDAERVVKQMRFEAPIPTDMWQDTTGKNRWLIQRTTRAVSDLWPLTEDLYDPNTGQLIRKAVYDKLAVSRVQPGMRDEQRVLDAARIRRDLPAPYGISADQTVDIYEFWGDFIDPNNGNTLYKNIVATFAGPMGRICIRPPQRNPFRHGKVPYVVIQAKLLPHQVYGYGLLRQNAKLETAINRHANILADKAMLQVPTLEYDASASKDPAIQAGSRPKFSPGKMWPRKPGPDKKIFYTVDGFKEITQMDLAWMDRLMNWYGMSSTVPDIESGQPQNNARRTKGEQELRAQAANENFNDAAVHIEEQAFGPMLFMIYATMVQYEDQYDDDDLTRMFGDDFEAQQFIQGLQSMTAAERWRALYLDTEFKAVGITNQQTRERKTQQINDFVRILTADPLTSMFVSRPELLNELLPLYQQNTRMILPQAEAVLQALQMAQIQAAGQPPPGPGGPGQPPGPGGPPQIGPSGAPGGVPFGGGKPAQGRNPHNSLAAVSGQAGRQH